jgi:Tol biopolymer transport system component
MNIGRRMMRGLIGVVAALVLAWGGAIEAQTPPDEMLLINGSSPSGYLPIYLANLETNTLTPVAPVETFPNVSHALWSPDGNAIAFIAPERKYEERIYRVSPMGRDIVPISKPAPISSYWNLAWSPDSRSLAVIRHTVFHSYPLIQIDVDTQSERTLYDFYESPLSIQWLPDGRQIAVTMWENRAFDLVIVDVESGAVERISTGYIGNTPCWMPSWSSDMREFVFCGRTDDEPTYQVYHFELDKRRLTRLTHEFRYDNTHFAWSPDDRHLVMWINPTIFGVSVAIFDLETRKQRILHTFPSAFSPPIWSSDGTRIAVAAADRIASYAYILNLDGQIIGRYPNHFYAPILSWRPQPTV